MNSMAWAARAAAMIRPRHVGPAVGDVGGDAVVEQHHLLADPAELSAQVGQRQAGERLAVEQDAAAARLVEAGDRLTRVLLPLPEAPTRATVWPGCTSRLKLQGASAWPG
jgi:hypothetical protein